MSIYNNFAYLRDEVFGIGGHLDAVLGFLGPPDRRMLDQVVHLVLIGVVEGRDPDNHLVDQDSEGPPIKSFVVSRADDHFRGEVLGRTAEGVRLLPVLLHDLCQPEVSQHDVAVVVEQDVFRLQVTVYNV